MATTSREDREAIFNRFRSGETRIICNVGVLTTGIDLDVRCIIHARPTKSRILFVQTIGRGLRTAEGKDHLLILDHAGNHLRLGMVTDIGQDRLDDGRDRQGARDGARERSKPLPKRCDECSAIVSCTARACPSCGAPIRAKTEVESAEGELVEFGSRRTGAPRRALRTRFRFTANCSGSRASATTSRDGWATSSRNGSASGPTILAFDRPSLVRQA